MVRGWSWDWQAIATSLHEDCRPVISCIFCECMHFCKGGVTQCLFRFPANSLFTVTYRRRACDRDPKGQSNGTLYANPGYGDQRPVRCWRPRRHDLRAGHHPGLNRYAPPPRQRGVGPVRPAPALRGDIQETQKAGWQKAFPLLFCLPNAAKRDKLPGRAD